MMNCTLTRNHGSYLYVSKNLLCGISRSRDVEMLLYNSFGHHSKVAVLCRKVHMGPENFVYTCIFTQKNICFNIPLIAELLIDIS